jgi:hypothetical protein
MREATLSDNDLLRLLAEIKTLALSPYPFPDDEEHELRLVLALGQIAGICDAQLSGSEHIASLDCWCGPVQDDAEEGVWVHGTRDRLRWQPGRGNGAVATRVPKRLEGPTARS